MHHRSASRIFVTYDPADLALARELQGVLRASGLSLHRDLADLDGARDWWWQVESTIKTVDHLVVVLTPKALRSHYIPIEWRLALSEGKSVWLVVGPKRLNFARLPRWMAHARRYDLAVPESREQLIAGLRRQVPRRPAPFMADARPTRFVERPGEFDAIKRKLLGARREPVAITSALRGVGGFGKTALAEALCQDPDIRDTFEDGILRVTLGEHPDDPVGTMAGLVFMLTGKRPDVARLGDARARLDEALVDRRCLLVIEDARRSCDLEPFLHRGRRDDTTRLIVTPDDRVLPPLAERIAVGPMTPAQASEVLVLGLPDRTLTAHASRLAALASRLGRWPLLLALANGVLRDRVACGASTQASLDRVERSLQERGLDLVLGAEQPEPRRGMAAAMLEICLERLGSDERDHFLGLSAFAEHAVIPVPAALGLWRQATPAGGQDGEALLARLDELSLLLHFNRPAGTFRLHPELLALMRERYSAGQLAELDRRLTAHFRSTCPDDDLALLSDAYGLRHAVRHLRNGGEGAAADALLLDPRWMLSKLETLGIRPLLGDYAGYRLDTAQGLVGATLARIANAIARLPCELAPQLIGRLTAGDAPGLATSLSKARRLLKPSALWPSRPTLALPDAELQRYDGHADCVTCAAILPGARHVLTGSRDKTLRLWDIDSGRTLQRLAGHEDWVTCVTALSDGRRALSGSKDGTLRLWDIASGAALRRFEGHEGSITGVAALPDGRRAVTAGHDHIVRLWDIELGTELRRFAGHDDWVNCVAALPDGRHILSGSDDKTLRLWDIESGGELRRLEEPGSVLSVAALADGRRALCGFDDNMMRLRDLASGTELQCFEGHSGWVTGIAVLPGEQRALSASDDNTLRLWDIRSGVELRRFGGRHEEDDAIANDIVGVAVALDGGRGLSTSDDNSLRLWDIDSSLRRRPAEAHEGWVMSVALLADGQRVLSGGQDPTLRLWNVASGVELGRFEAHESGVTAVAMLPDGRRALSASYDGTLSSWDVDSGIELQRFEGHEDGVHCVAPLPDGRRALSGSSDNTLRLWDVDSGAELRCLKGHGESVTCVALLPDGSRALSGSFDNSLRLWDIESGKELRYFEGHTDRVQCVAVLPDGRRALSGADDHTFRLWDIESGAELRRFEGHRDLITCLIVLPDERRALSGSHDRSLRLWNLESGNELACLTFDELVGAVAWSQSLQLAVVGDGLGQIHTITIGDGPADIGLKTRPKRATGESRAASRPRTSRSGRTIPRARRPRD
ncbi:MAG: TIR domain-containing protein [Enhydrobacter sp.]|nr:TIR domain-containing protein [Enhydrobacter sp.]